MEPHLRWQESLGETTYRRLIANRQFTEVARLAIAIDSRTNLLFSFEKMALRDAVRSPAGAKAFATALFELLHGTEAPDARFASWVEALEYAASSSDPCPYMAGRHRLWINRAAQGPFLLQADRHPRSLAAMRFALWLRVRALVARLQVALGCREKGAS